MDFHFNMNVIIINLETLGKLEPGNKLNVRSEYFSVDMLGWNQGIMRLLRGDDRKLTYHYIKILILDVQLLLDPSKSYYTLYKYTNINDFYLYINPILKKAYNGILTLFTTYEGDTTFLSQINVELNRLKILIDRTNIKDKVV